MSIDESSLTKTFNINIVKFIFFLKLLGQCLRSFPTPASKIPFDIFYCSFYKSTFHIQVFLIWFVIVSSFLSVFLFPCVSLCSGLWKYSGFFLPHVKDQILCKFLSSRLLCDTECKFGSFTLSVIGLHFRFLVSAFSTIQDQIISNFYCRFPEPVRLFRLQIKEE